MTSEYRKRYSKEHTDSKYVQVFKVLTEIRSLVFITQKIHLWGGFGFINTEISYNKKQCEVKYKTLPTHLRGKNKLLQRKLARGLEPILSSLGKSGQKGPGQDSAKLRKYYLPFSFLSNKGKLHKGVFNTFSLLFEMPAFLQPDFHWVQTNVVCRPENFSHVVLFYQSLR